MNDGSSDPRIDLAGESTVAPPWTWSWIRWQPGEAGTFFWICLIHALAAVGFILFPWPGWPLLGFSYALMWIGGLGTTVAYHRALAHKSVKLHPVVEAVLIGAAVFNGSGTPTSWTANHRFHHKNSDKPTDISSPRVGGFWWAHLRWLWQAPPNSSAVWAPDLDTPRYRFWTRAHLPMLGLALCAGLAFGWAAFFWLGAIRLAAALHAQCCANSISHLTPKGTEGDDSSRNVAWLAPFQGLQGENWHRNHHSRPANPRLGWTWKQIDLGWWCIALLEKLGLATDVRRPKLQAAAVSVDAALPRERSDDREAVEVALR